MSKMSELHAERKIEPVDAHTLRDQIAIAAMQSLLLRPDYKNAPCEAITQSAYIYADEMLAARGIKR